LSYKYSDSYEEWWVSVPVLQVVRSG